MSDSKRMRAFGAFLAFTYALSTGAFDAAGQEPEGFLVVDVTDLLGHPLRTKVELWQEGGTAPVSTFVAPKGQIETAAPAGTYQAFTWVYDEEVPLVVDVQELSLEPGKETFLPLNVAEASGMHRRLREFDRDADLVLDRVEEDHGTDPEDAASFPGAVAAPFPSFVVDDKSAWRRGDLHVRSKHDGGEEDIEALLKRARKADLDFIAVADNNTLAAYEQWAAEEGQPDVALVPAMAWGSPERGTALLYGARTVPPPPGRPEDDQAIAYRLQSQGGVYAIAHPCFPTAAWQRNVSDVNLVEVWCREWRSVPPIALEALDGMLRRRDKEKGLVLPIAKAANTPHLSANGQALLFYDLELERGLKASPIGGSLSSSGAVAMGEPVTYVFAPENSAEGILEGLRLGHTFVSEGPKGPRLFIEADLFEDRKIDSIAGGIIPAGVPAVINVAVFGAKGAKLQLIRNGNPIVSKIIEGEAMTIQHKLLTRRSRPDPGEEDNPVANQDPGPAQFAVFRAQVLAPKPGGGFEDGFGDTRMLALTAPIYSIPMMFVGGKLDPNDAWKPVRRDKSAPVFIDRIEGPDGKPLFVSPRNGGQRTMQETFSPPPGSIVRELQPKGR